MTEKPRKKKLKGAPSPGKRGRKPKYFDPLHQRQREASRRYYWRRKWESQSSPSTKDKQSKKWSE